MVRLSWIVFEFGFATGLPRQNIIQQKREDPISHAIIISFKLADLVTSMLQPKT
jgi:hypothetical protein